MVKCPECNANQKGKDLVLLFVLNRMITCSECNNKLRINFGRMKVFFGVFYSLGILFGMSLISTGNPADLIPILVVFIIAIVVFVYKAKLKKLGN